MNILYENIKMFVHNVDYNKILIRDPVYVPNKSYCSLYGYFDINQIIS